MNKQQTINTATTDITPSNHHSRRTVFIPVVAKSTATVADSQANAELVQIYAQSCQAIECDAESEQKARDKDWPVIAVPLRQTGSALFQAACAAISAVRSLSLKKPRFALYQFFKPHSWLDTLRLYAAGHRGPSEGGSAQLGLALVLLMAATRTRTHNIIASGALSSESRRLYDAKVCAVGKMREKLQLVLQRAKAGQLASANDSGSTGILFFTPVHYEDAGNPAKVADLPEVSELRQHGVYVEPVAWLSEAAAKLQAHTTCYHIWDRIYQSLLAVILLLGMLTTTWFYWLYSELPMSFIAADRDGRINEPFLSCFDPQGNFEPVKLRRSGVATTIPIGTTLGWRLSVGTAHSFDNKLISLGIYDGYYLALIMLSEHSPAKIIIPNQQNSNTPLRLKPGDSMQWGWKLNQQTEANRLVILSQRQRPFDAEQLRNALIKRFPGAQGSSAAALDITAASNYLSALGNGSLSFQFLTVNTASDCRQ